MRVFAVTLMLLALLLACTSVEDAEKTTLTYYNTLLSASEKCVQDLNAAGSGDAAMKALTDYVAAYKAATSDFKAKAGGMRMTQENQNKLKERLQPILRKLGGAGAKIGAAAMQAAGKFPDKADAIKDFVRNLRSKLSD